MQFQSSFKIGRFSISPRSKALIIAELSANHNQDYDLAVKTIKAFKKAGADAVKLQTYTPDTMTLNLNRGNFKIPRSNQFAGPKTLYELYQIAYTPWEWQPKLKRLADKLGLLLFSTPFDPTAVDFLKTKVKVDVYKIASFEFADHNLLKKVAQTGKPVIVSNGGATAKDIAESIEVLGSNGCSKLMMLQCSSGYPALPEQMNLPNMHLISQTYGIPTGVSDHSPGIGVAVAAAALGARAIEKHVTLNKRAPGPDHRFSMEPQEFQAMVTAIRQAEKAVKEVSFIVSQGRETENKKRFDRSLYIVEDTKAGAKLLPSNLKAIRPSDGLHPRYFQILLGMKLTKSASKGTPFTWDLVK